MVGWASREEKEDLFRSIDRIAEGMARLGAAAAWIGHEGDGRHMGALESHTKMTTEAVTGGLGDIADAIRDGMHEIADAIKKQQM